MMAGLAFGAAVASGFCLGLAVMAGKDRYWEMKLRRANAMAERYRREALALRAQARKRQQARGLMDATKVDGTMSRRNSVDVPEFLRRAR